MQNGTQNLAQAIEADVSQDYPATPQKRSATPNIDQLILLLVPSRKHSEITRLFDNRTSYGTIKQWRRGRRTAPQWARDLLSAKLAARAAEFNAMADLAHKEAEAAAKWEAEHPRGNIRHYNRDRFAQKKKPANEAGQVQGDLNGS